MRCSKCDVDFVEKDIQLSHDVPKYIDGTDSDGRHYLCKRCHDVYEKTIFAIMVKHLPEHTKESMRTIAKGFSKLYFKEEVKDGLT